MNVWVAPLDSPQRARPITRDAGRGARIYEGAYDGRHILFLKDRDGDENWRLHAVDIHTGAGRPLTAEGARATLSRTSRRRRGEVLVDVNERDPRYPDLFRVDIASGESTLAAENPGFGGFISDDDLVPRLAVRPPPDGGEDVLRTGEGGWEPWFHIPAEDSFTTGITHLGADGASVYMRDSRGR